MSYPPVPDAPPPAPDPNQDRTGAARWDPAPAPPAEPQWAGQVAYKPTSPPPNSNMALAIIATFLFFPIGLLAVIKASTVNNLWHTGNPQLAYRNADGARTLSIMAIAIGALGWIVAWVFVLAVFSVAPIVG